MEVYKSIYDVMLSKVISYGYVEQQVLDIISESHGRIELSIYKNIPDGERYSMAERWAWEILCKYSPCWEIVVHTNTFASCRGVGNIFGRETAMEGSGEIFEAYVTYAGKSIEESSSRSCCSYFIYAKICERMPHSTLLSIFPDTCRRHIHSKPELRSSIKYTFHGQTSQVLIFRGDTNRSW